MKIALLNDTGNFENIGSQLTSACLKLAILEAFAELNPKPRIESWPWKWGKNSRRIRSFLASVPFFLGGKEKPAAYLRWLKVLSTNEYGKDACQSALEADLVVFQPEGSFYERDDIHKLTAILSLPTLCQRLGKRVVCLNGTFPEYPDSRGDFIGSFLRDCRWVALRDRRSASYYNTEFMPDLAFSYRPWESVPKQAPTPSDFVLITTGAGFSRKRNRQLARAALDFCRDNRLRPLVLTKLAFHLEGLRSEIETMRGHLLIRRSTISEATQLIAQCCFHIGGRYHMAILASTLSVPSVLVRTNTHKNEWLSGEVSGIQMVQSEEQIAMTARALLNRSHKHEVNMSNDVERMRSMILTKMPQIRAQSIGTSTTLHGSSARSAGQRMEDQLIFSDLARCLFKDQKKRRYKALRNLRMKILSAKNRVFPYSILRARRN